MALITSLESYWKLDETSGDAIDTHGSNTLTDNNTVTAGTGKINGARDFELSNTEFFSKADNASLSVAIGTGFTWSCWVKLESLPAGGGFEEVIIGKSDFSATTEYVMYSQFDGKFVFYAGNGTTGANAIWGSIPSTATWYHVVGWYDPAAGGTNNISVDNGTPVSAANIVGIYDGLTAFRMGACSNNTRYFDGLIDEVGFWKKVLTSAERTLLYNNGNGLEYSLFSMFSDSFVSLSGMSVYSQPANSRHRVVSY